MSGVSDKVPQHLQEWHAKIRKHYAPESGVSWKDAMKKAAQERQEMGYSSKKDMCYGDKKSKTKMCYADK